MKKLWKLLTEDRFEYAVMAFWIFLTGACVIMCIALRAYVLAGGGVMNKELIDELEEFLNHVAAYARSLRAEAGNNHSPIRNYMSKDALEKTASHFYHLIEPAEKLAIEVRAAKGG